MRGRVSHRQPQSFLQRQLRGFEAGDRVAGHVLIREDWCAGGHFRTLLMGPFVAEVPHLILHPLSCPCTAPALPNGAVEPLPSGMGI